MEIDEVLEFIQKEMPDRAKELRSKAGLLMSTFDNIRCEIDGSIGKFASKREFDKANTYINMSKKLASVMDELESYMKKCTSEINVIYEQQNVSRKPSSKNYKDVKKYKKVSTNVVCADKEKKDGVISVKNIFEGNSEDYRFAKDSYIKESDPLINGMNQKIGTPSHIGYLKMSDGDTRRHKSRCVKYDKKKNICTCVKSPYYATHCGGSSHCKFYSEEIK